MTKQRHAVTGAFGYSGKYIARRLLDKGYQVITLTNSLHRTNPFGDRVKAYPFNFDNPAALADSLQGVSVLYNTYWVRFDHKTFTGEARKAPSIYQGDKRRPLLSLKRLDRLLLGETLVRAFEKPQESIPGFLTHAAAIENTLTLFTAAKKAGVQRIVHVSITNPSENSPLAYFSGKAKLERALIDSGLSYAILRPTVLFGQEDILINNIAWTLRKLPVFGVFGNGRYRLQPIYVDDLAQLAVTQGEQRENIIINAIGPETFSYRELVQAIGQIIGKPRPLISVSPRLGYWVGWLMGQIVGDVMITREEIEGLMADLLYVDSPPVGSTKLTEWVTINATTLGKQYTSELARRKG